MKFLIVVDMQNDFITGSLGTKEAEAILPKVLEKIRTYRPEQIFVTQDTHPDNYLETNEGRHLPVAHCIAGSQGHALHPLVAEALVGAGALVLAEGFPRQLIAIFGAANESSYYTDFAIKAFRTYLCMMVLACVNKACFIFLQAVGKALSSTLLSMFREVVFGVGFALLLPVFFGLDGVLYSMPVSDILTFIISAIIIVKTYRELNVEGAQKV